MEYPLTFQYHSVDRNSEVSIIMQFYFNLKNELGVCLVIVLIIQMDKNVPIFKVIMTIKKRQAQGDLKSQNSNQFSIQKGNLLMTIGRTICSYVVDLAHAVKRNFAIYQNHIYIKL